MLVLTASAQMERTVYQVFEVDSARTVTLDIVGFTYPELHIWAGNNILTEANIQVWEATPEIVNELIKTGRYAFESERNGDSLRVFTKVRKPSASNKRRSRYLFRISTSSILPSGTPTRRTNRKHCGERRIEKTAI